MKRLLIIEEDRDIRRSLKGLLFKEGYAVDEAKDGADGWRRISSDGYDLVMLDIQMPGMSPGEFIGYLRHIAGLDPAVGNVRVLLICANPLTGPQKEWVSSISRVSGYVMKPFDKGEVLEKVRAALASEPPQEPAPAEAPQPKAAEGMRLEAATLYLVDGAWPERGIRLLVMEMSAGRCGLYVTRYDPRLIREKYGLDGVPLVWLTNINDEKGVKSVSGLQELAMHLSEYLVENARSVILLEGLEYLTANNDFQVVLRFIQYLRDLISTTETLIIIPINPNALEQRQMSLLGKECIRLP